MLQIGILGAGAMGNVLSQMIDDADDAVCVWVMMLMLSSISVIRQTWIC